MEISGKQLIAEALSSSSDDTFHSVNPQTGAAFGSPFYEATLEEVDDACWLADQAYNDLRVTSAELRGRLLDAIADEMMALGDQLLERAHG